MIKKSTKPIWAVAVLWVVAALFFPMYRLLHFALLAVGSVAIFFIAKQIWPNRTLVVPDPAPVPEPPTEAEMAFAALQAERVRALGEMKRLNDAIGDEKISAQIAHLETVAGKIFDYIEKNPSKRGQIRPFMDYYLPTTLKILNAYDRMDDAGISGTHIDGTMGKIEAMMETVTVAFDKQLDNLFGSEAMDITSDITVMEQMMAREGIGGTQLPKFE